MKKQGPPLQELSFFIRMDLTMFWLSMHMLQTAWGLKCGSGGTHWQIDLPHFPCFAFYFFNYGFLLVTFETLVGWFDGRRNADYSFHSSPSFKHQSLLSSHHFLLLLSDTYLLLMNNVSVASTNQWDPIFMPAFGLDLLWWQSNNNVKGTFLQYTLIGPLPHMEPLKISYYLWIRQTGPT